MLRDRANEKEKGREGWRAIERERDTQRERERERERERKRDAEGGRG